VRPKSPPGDRRVWLSLMMARYCQYSPFGVKGRIEKGSTCENFGMSSRNLRGTATAANLITQRHRQSATLNEPARELKGKPTYGLSRLADLSGESLESLPQFVTQRGLPDERIQRTTCHSRRNPCGGFGLPDLRPYHIPGLTAIPPGCDRPGEDVFSFPQPCPQ